FRRRPPVPHRARGVIAKARALGGARGFGLCSDVGAGAISVLPRRIRILSHTPHHAARPSPPLPAWPTRLLPSCKGSDLPRAIWLRASAAVRRAISSCVGLSPIDLNFPAPCDATG